MSFFISIAYSALYTIGPESFPTNARRLGTGVTGMLGRTGGILSPIFTNLILQLKMALKLILLSLLLFLLYVDY